MFDKFVCMYICTYNYVAKGNNLNRDCLEDESFAYCIYSYPSLMEIKSNVIRLCGILVVNVV